MEAIRTAVTVPLDPTAAIGARKGKRAGVVARTLAAVRWQLRLLLRRRRMAATRDALESLDDRMLKDIGLRRMEIHSAVSSLYDSRVQGLPKVLVREPH